MHVLIPRTEVFIHDELIMNEPISMSMLGLFENRQPSKKGILVGYVPGTRYEAYFIDHLDDDERAPYLISEFEVIKNREK